MKMDRAAAAIKGGSAVRPFWRPWWVRPGLPSATISCPEPTTVRVAFGDLPLTSAPGEGLLLRIPIKATVQYRGLDGRRRVNAARIAQDLLRRGAMGELLP